MDVLYFSPGAASFGVHWMLVDTGHPPELRRVDLGAGQQRSAEYLALNPAGVVPTLVVDGRAFAESGALMLMLADRYPDAGLLPPAGTNARGLAYQWMLQLVNALQPPFRTWFYPHEAAGEAAASDAKRLAAERIGQMFDRIDCHLAAHGPYLLGERLSAPDFMLVMLCRWSRNMPKPATEWPALKRFIDLMRSRPSFVVTCDREGLEDWRS